MTKKENKMNFNNCCSEEGFIGNRNLDNVIAQDYQELQKINGSFETIAGRMDYIISLEDKQRGDYLQAKRTEIFSKYGYNHTELTNLSGRINDLSTDYGKILAEISQVFHTPWTLPNELSIAITNVIRTRGMQFCPFGDKAGSNMELTVQNLKTGKKVTINHLTSHLARVHHLLEKDNQYGISALEFYKHFMPAN